LDRERIIHEKDQQLFELQARLDSGGGDSKRDRGPRQEKWSASGDSTRSGWQGSDSPESQLHFSDDASSLHSHQRGAPAPPTGDRLSSLHGGLGDAPSSRQPPQKDGASAWPPTPTGQLGCLMYAPALERGMVTSRSPTSVHLRELTWPTSEVSRSPSMGNFRELTWPSSEVLGVEPNPHAMEGISTGPPVRVAVLQPQPGPLCIPSEASKVLVSPKLPHRPVQGAPPSATATPILQPRSLQGVQSPPAATPMLPRRTIHGAVSPPPGTPLLQHRAVQGALSPPGMTMSPSASTCMLAPASGCSTAANSPRRLRVVPPAAGKKLAPYVVQTPAPASVQRIQRLASAV